MIVECITQQKFIPIKLEITIESKIELEHILDVLKTSNHSSISILYGELFRQKELLKYGN